MRAGASWSFGRIAHVARERSGPMLVSTSLLTLALLPLALALDAPGQEILAPMAVVMIAGALSGFLANLTVLPIMAWIIWRPGAVPHSHHHGEPA